MSFASTLQPEYPRDRRRRDRRGDAEIGLCRQRPGEGLRRRGRCAAGGRHARDAEADQHLLQPRGAGLRDLDRRGLSPGRRQARRCRGRRRHQPARRAGSDARHEEAISRTAGSARSPPKCSAERREPDAWRALVLCGRHSLLAAPPRRRTRRCVSYEIVGDAIPASLTGAPGDPARGRAIVADRRVGTVPAVPYRPVPGAAFAGHAGAGPGGRRVARWSRGADSPADCRCQPAQSGHDHAALLPAPRLDARGARLCRQADPHAAQIEDVVAFLGDIERLEQR